MYKRTLVIATITATMVGCATGPTPQTGDEFRQTIAKGGFGTKLEVLEVNRSYTSVAKTLKEKSQECLNTHIVKTECINRSCTEYDVFYLPTFKNTNNKVDLVVQWRRDPWRSVFTGGKPPKNGVYITAVDAMPAGKNKTKVTIYGPSNKVSQTVPNAIKHWAVGDNLGCPDLAQTHWY